MMIEDEDGAKLLLTTGNDFKNLMPMIEEGNGMQNLVFFFFKYFANFYVTKNGQKNLCLALLFVWVRKPNPAQLQKFKNPCLRLILIRLRI